MGSTVTSKPLTSLKPACWMLSISNRKRKFLNGSLRGIFSSLSTLVVNGYETLELSYVRIPRELCNAKDDEFGWFNRGDTDNTDQASIIDVILGHGSAVDFHKERLFHLGPH